MRFFVKFREEESSNQSSSQLVELAREIDSLKSLHDFKGVEFGPLKAAELLVRIEKAQQLLQEAVDGRQFSDEEIHELESVVRALRFIHGLDLP